MCKINHEIITINPKLNMQYTIVHAVNSYTSLHWHDSLEMIYLLDGEMNAEVNRTTYTLCPGDYIIIDRKIIHATNCKKADYLLIQIPYSFLKMFIPNINTCTIGCVNSFIQKDNCSLNSMRENFEQLTYLYVNQTEEGYLEYYSILFHLLHVLITDYKQNISPVNYNKTEKYIDRLSLVTEYVQEHYNEPISLEEAAGLLCVNPQYFSRFFKKHMGITFLEYVYSIRLQAAYRDIVQTSLTIQQVQEKNGFTNPKIFGRMFKEKYGATPRQVRKSIQSKTRS